MVDKSEKPPETAGVLGDGALHPGKYNMALVRKAIREGWPISDDIRRLVVNQMALVVGKSEEERNRISAAKVLVSADSVNTKREATEAVQHHEHHHSGTIDLTAVRQEVLYDSSRLDALRNHQGDGDTGVICEGSGPTLEAGPAPEVPRQGTNGHLNGNGRH